MNQPYLQQYGPPRWGNMMNNGYNNMRQGMRQGMNYVGNMGSNMYSMYQKHNPGWKKGLFILFILAVVVTLIVLGIKYKDWMAAKFDNLKVWLGLETEAEQLAKEVAALLAKFDLTTMSFITGARDEMLPMVTTILKDNNYTDDATKMKDITLLTIILENGDAAALDDTIKYKIPKLHNDTNYIAVMSNYDQTTKAFKSGAYTDRNTAITILGHYYTAKTNTTNVQSMSDENIYKELLGDIKWILD